MKRIAITVALVVAALQAGAGAPKPAVVELSADHQRMFCGDPDGETAGAYARAVSSQVNALIAAGERDVGAALAKMRQMYCARKGSKESKQ